MRLASCLLAFAFTIGPLSAGSAQSQADFYKGKTVDMMIGYSVGGGYDVYARLIARHLGKHIPGNPIVTPKNMDGAGSLRLANWLYNVASKDGLVLGTIGRGTGFDPLLGSKTAHFDGTKFNWIGSANDEVSVCVVWNGRSKVTKFDDLLTQQLAVGGTGAAADTDQFPRIINGVLGTKMKIITGYPGGNDVNLAMERGEVDGRCGWSWSSVKSTRATWVGGKQITILTQLALAKHPDLPDVPLIVDLAKNDEQRQILKLIFARQSLGRPYRAPPGVPAERVAMLRKAFMDTMADKEFLAEAEKAQLEITPIAGEAVQKLVADVYQTPAEIAHKAAEILR
jgi:tripartite-type tricarboxylate transporter receptor subunit TctC